MSHEEVRLVVVDDDVDAAFVLSELLRSEGYSVRVGHNAAEALNIVAQFNPLGVLLDLGLPDHDGLEVARQLRCDQDPSMVLVAVTGRAGDHERQAALAAGIDFVIVKPVDLKVLRSIFPAV
jgi:CheY-like chemotaxis protein